MKDIEKEVQTLNSFDHYHLSENMLSLDTLDILIEGLYGSCSTFHEALEHHRSVLMTREYEIKQFMKEVRDIRQKNAEKKFGEIWTIRLHSTA